jgi:hypothetical protein
MALGGILLLRNLGIITFDNWHLFWGTFWAGAFLLAGLSVLVGARKPAAWIWGLLLVAIGASIGLNTYNVISISMWEIFWPAMLIAGGLMLALSIGPGGMGAAGDQKSQSLVVVILNRWQFFTVKNHG